MNVILHIIKISKHSSFFDFEEDEKMLTEKHINTDALRDAYNECEKAVNTLGKSIKEITHIVEQAFEDGSM